MGPKTTAKLIKTGTGVAKYFATQNKPQQKKPPPPPPGARKIATAKLPAKQPARTPVPRPSSKPAVNGKTNLPAPAKPSPTAPSVTSSTYKIFGKEFPKKAVNWTAGIGSLALAFWGGYEITKAINRR